MNSTHDDQDIENLKILHEKCRELQPGIVASLKELANQLNVVAKHDSHNQYAHWTWNYMHGLINNKRAPSQRVRKAIRRLYRKQMNVEKTTLESITVIAPIGYAANNTLLNTRSRKCARADCGVWFIPTTHNQRFHSATCRRLSKFKP
jgi:hypothetical protein